jgi:2-oxoglutarate dehydrogenase E2 component (dihydrolipoamide succinyltransferase)
MIIELKVPSVGESITEVEIGNWLKSGGDTVNKDEPIVTLESEKATVELPSPQTGVLAKVLKQKGQVAKIGEVIGQLDTEASARPRPAAALAKPPQEKAHAQAKEAPEAAQRPARPPAEQRIMPAAERALEERGLHPEEVRATGPGGRLLKEDVLRHLEQAIQAPSPSAPEQKSEGREPRAESGATQAPSLLAPEEAAQAEPGPGPELAASPIGQGIEIAPGGPGPSAITGREEETAPMSRLRRTVAERLVQAQHTAALLTTFNEIDMSSVQALRKEHGEAFLKRYSIKLGFMSFFVKACVDALKQFPVLNAEVRQTNIVYHNYYDIGVAVGSGKGLVVPVLRNAERMSFAEVERAVADFARRARENKLTLDELQGGTFTISNGGVYGSLLSTPIVNPPQSGVLGMHAIQERPVARQGNVVIRPMMYVALTYDHRIVDGREAVSALRRIKEVIENPTRILMEV